MTGRWPMRTDRIRSGTIQAPSGLIVTFGSVMNGTDHAYEVSTVMLMEPTWACLRLGTGPLVGLRLLWRVIHPRVGFAPAAYLLVSCPKGPR
jgi:hypothetical protein